MTTTGFVRLKEVADFMGGGTPSRKHPKYFGGDIPWVKTTDLNNGRISSTEETITSKGLADSSCKMVPANSVLVAMYGGFNQIGRTGLLVSSSAINQALTAILSDPERLDPEFLLEWLNYRAAYWKRFAASSRKDPNITKGDIADFPVPDISIDQQRAANRFFISWGSAIEKSRQLIAAKKLHLSCRREHLLANYKTAKPIKLKMATRESTVRNGAYLGRDAIMAVTKSVGMRPMREETIAASIDRYKLVKPKAFAYNPMRLNIGSIAMSSFDRDVLVSPDYVVFECDESKLLPGYLEHLRHTRLWGRHFEAAGSGGVRIRIYYDDLGAFAFPLPPVAQQLRVLAALDAAKAEIETLESYLAALQQQKRGLMQKLLTGQWRVKPSFSKE